jgi:hypothetical protein
MDEALIAKLCRFFGDGVVSLLSVSHFVSGHYD